MEKYKQYMDNPDWEFIQGEPNQIVVEKREQILGDFKGDGSQQLMGVNTGTHASGDDQGVNVPDGSFVYSDTKDLKIKDKDILKNFGTNGSAKTPAQLAKKYDLQKYQSIIDNPQSDAASKKTAEMMITNYTNKLNQLSSLQESMKGALDIHKEHKMKYGGKTPMYEEGGKKSMNRYDDVFDQGMYDETGRGFNVANPLAQRRFSPLPQNTTNNAGSFQPLGEEINVQRNGIDPWQPVLGEQSGTGTTNSSSPQYMSPQFAMNSSDNTTIPVPETKQADLHTKQWNPSLSANQWGNITMGLKALGLKKFVPVNPQINAVIPQTVMESDIPVRNALSENTNAATNALYTGNATAGRANALALQGELGKNAINLSLIHI